MRLAWRRATSAVVLLFLAGCGTAGSGGDGATRTPRDDVARGPATELRIVVDAGRGAGERRYMLTCDPAGGDHPDPATACRLLDRMKEPFEPVPRGAMCTEVYGGPQTATVSGTLRGEPVEAEFDRTDGCQIARWDRHGALLAEKGGVANR